MVALSSEDRMRANVHRDVEITGRTAVLAGTALALQPDPLIVGDPGRNPDLHGPRSLAPPRAVADRAGIVHDHSPTTAVAARLSHRKHAARRRGLHPAAFARRTYAGHGACLGPGAAARLAGCVGDHLHPDGDTLDGLDEVDRDLTLDITAPPGTARRGVARGTGTASATEQAAEKIGEVRVAGVAEQVVDSDPTTALTGPGTGEAETTATEQPTRLVVLLALGLVRQHVVRLRDLLEAALSLRVARVLIGMVVPRQLAVGPLDLLRFGVFVNAQDLVEVLLYPVLGTHQRLPSECSIAAAAPSACRGVIRSRPTGESFSAVEVITPAATCCLLLLVVEFGLICTRLVNPLILLRRGYRRLGFRRSGVRVRLSDSDPGRPQDAITEPIARLQNLDTRWPVDALGMSVQECLVDVRVEPITSFPVCLEAVLGRHPLDLVRDSLEAAGQLAVLVSRPYVVQHGQEVLQDSLDRPRPNNITIPIHPALVVDVLRLQPLEIGSPLGQRGGQLRYRAILDRAGIHSGITIGEPSRGALRGGSRSSLRLPHLVRLGVDAPVVPNVDSRLGFFRTIRCSAHLDSLVFSSSSTISASTTSSSAVELAPLVSACSLGSPASAGGC